MSIFQDGPILWPVFILIPYISHAEFLHTISTIHMGTKLQTLQSAMEHHPAETLLSGSGRGINRFELVCYRVAPWPDCGKITQARECARGSF